MISLFQRWILKRKLTKAIRLVESCACMAQADGQLCFREARYLNTSATYLRAVRGAVRDYERAQLCRQCPD